MDVTTFLRQQRDAAEAELRHIGQGGDIASRALRLPHEARDTIAAWLVENRVTEPAQLEGTLQAVTDQREVVPNLAPKVAAGEAGYLLRRWRWFNPVSGVNPET